MAAPVVFVDIAGPDIGPLAYFYSNVFGWDIGTDGRFTISVASPLPPTLRQDPADTMLYLGVDDVTATLAKIELNGGAIIASRFEVPGVVILGLFTDPAGNRMGPVEMDGDRARVP